MTLRETALSIFDEAVRAADPYETVRKAVSVVNNDVVIDGVVYPSSLFPHIVVVGSGKASSRMGKAIEDVLGNRIEKGIVTTKYGHAESLSFIDTIEAGHPVPDEKGVEGSRRMIDLLEKADDKTLVIGLISGGGSALSPAPVNGVTLEEKQTVTRLLLNAGASITELNTIRKHISALKGGGMARLAFPAHLHMLILSDVIGDRLDTIASGPATADLSTFIDCLNICNRYGIEEQLPLSVRERLYRGVSSHVSETAKPGDAYLDTVRTTLVGNNALSVAAASEKAKSFGFTPLVLTTTLEGEASQAGKFFASIASEIRRSGNPAPIPACVIAGGETTVTVKGKGKGGRNQEMALSAAIGIAGYDETVFLSGGTDGTDGPTDAAGGIVDGETIGKGVSSGLNVHDFLADNNSYEYLHRVGGLIKTGPTGTNVMDIQLLIIGNAGNAL